MSLLTSRIASTTAAPRISLPFGGDTQAAGMVDGTRRSSGPTRIILDRTHTITMRTSRMTSRQQRSLQSFRRVQGWAVAHADILKAAPLPVSAHLAKLGEYVVSIESNATQQVAQHQLSTRSSTDATVRRTAVRDAMLPITQVARALSGTVFGISAISTMPKKADNERLVTAAASMVENATIFKTTLIEHGLQPDCIETLQTAAAALKSSVDARGLAKSAGVGASKGIHADIPQGKKLVSLMDAGLLPQLRKDLANLASWRNAKRVTTKGAVGVIPPASGVAASSTTPLAATAATTVSAVPTVAAAPTASVTPAAPTTPAASAVPAVHVA